MSTQNKEVGEGVRAIKEEEKMISARMSKVKHKIAVMSGKGGVGKSVVTANLAASFAVHGHLVGILDADIHGPSIPKLLDIRGQMLQAGPPGIFPVFGPLRMKIVSMDFLLPSDETPVIWRGPLKMGAIRQFLSEVVWGPLDYLLIDLPPGTGDEPLSIAQLIPRLDGVIIVTIPSEVSQIVVKRSVGFARRVGLKVIGLIENMSTFTCPNCGEKYDVFGSGGGRKIADELKVPFLGSIPLDPRIAEDSDKGTPFIINHPETDATKAFEQIVERIKETISNH